MPLRFYVKSFLNFNLSFIVKAEIQRRFGVKYAWHKNSQFSTLCFVTMRWKIWNGTPCIFKPTLAGHCRVCKSDLRTSLSPPTSFQPFGTPLRCNSMPQSVLGLHCESRSSMTATKSSSTNWSESEKTQIQMSSFHFESFFSSKSVLPTIFIDWGEANWLWQWLLWEDSC